MGAYLRRVHRGSQREHDNAADSILFRCASAYQVSVDGSTDIGVDRAVEEPANLKHKRHTSDRTDLVGVLCHGFLAVALLLWESSPYSECRSRQAAPAHEQNTDQHLCLAA